MIANGNSFGLNGNSNFGGSSGVQDPESAEYLGDLLMWGWIGFQRIGNAL